jgi:hypothetical protein
MEIRKMLHRIVIRLLVLSLVGLPLAYAQTNNGRIEGIVEDTSGGVVPGARLTATYVKTELKVSATSGAQGEFVLTPLPPGIYRLSAEASGFRESEIEAIEVNVGAVVPQIVKLEVGTVNERVTVAANALTVATTDVQITRAINIRDIDTLPQLGRTPITLTAYQPGVQTNPGDVSFSRVNGLRQGANNSKLDGIDINDSVVPRLGLSLTANNTDSIGEFRMVLGGGKAEYGRNAGGQVEMITRSGSNDFHGNAYDYLRNTDLNANDFFSNQSGSTRPKFIQNIAGGSFGGRIFRDKTFIFGNYQARRTRQETVRNRTVYTPSAKQGIFKWTAGGATNSYNFAAADPRGIGIDKGVAAINAQMPDPNNFDLGDGLNTAGFRFNTPSNSYEDQFTIKGDQNVTNTNHAFLRWSWQRNSSIDTLNNAERTYPGQVDGTQGGRRWGFAAGDDWTFKPTLVNEFRIGYQSASVDFLRPNRPNGPAYITNLVTDVQYAPFPQGRNSPVIDVTENLSWLHGTHTFKMGTNIRRTKQYGYNLNGTQPNLSTTTGNGNAVSSSIGPQGLTATQRSTFDQLYNDIMGRLDRVIETFYSDLTKFQAAGSPQVRNFLLREGGFFFQDDWKLSRKLTLNLGLRYEVFLNPIEQDSLQGVLDQAALVDGIHRINNLKLVKSRDWFGTDWNNFAPRVGFAYDPAADGKTAIRGSFGIFYDRTMGSVVSGIDSNTIGFVQQVPVYPNQGGADIRYSDTYSLPQTPGAPVLQLPDTRSTNIRLADPNLRTGYVANWTLGVQREILSNTVLDVGYVANRGTKLYLHRDLNQPQVTPALLSDFKELAAYAGNSAAPVSASNVFVSIFGTPAAAVSALNATNLTQGRLGTVLNTLDTNSSNFSRYAAAGLPDTFLRAYPQFNQMQLGTNDGRSYYDSLQVSIRRTTGALKSSFNYTWSHALDNVGGYSTTSSSQEGNGFAPPIDNYNLRLMRGTADFDHRHVFNSSIAYTLPIGKGKKFLDRGGIVDTLIGGWDIGTLVTWQTGAPFSIFSQRATAPEPTTSTYFSNSWINYSGPTNIGSVQRRGNGVFFFSPDQMAALTSSSVFPGPGEIGTSGRNLFHNPRYFNTDASLVKRFRIHENHAITFRAEAYNLFNNPNFTLISSDTSTNNLNVNNPSSFGKFSQTVGSQQSSSLRTMQMTLRYDF